MIIREIPKKAAPTVQIDEMLCSLLTSLCFGVEQDLDPVDLIFVYGTPFFIEQAALKLASLLHLNISNKVIIAGGIMPYGETYLQQKSEARLIYDEIADQFKNIDFYLEEKSQNTLDNVIESLKILNFSSYNKVCFVFPSHGTNRGYLTLKKFLPSAKITPASYDSYYPEDGCFMAKDTWHHTEQGKQRIWGEFLRIQEYGNRGDIALDDRTKNLLAKIDQIIFAA